MGRRIDNADLVFRGKSGTGDYHNEMNIEHFMEWFMNRLLPNCPPRSVIVLDNAKYQNSVFEKIPTKSSTKKFMMEWRTKRGVVYDSRSLKAELFLTVKAQNAKPTYLTDIKAAEFGFDLIRLPVGHCELNLIELVWAQVKGYAARNNKVFTVEPQKCDQARD